MSTKKTFRKIRQILNRHQSILRTVLPEGEYEMYCAKYVSNLGRKMEKFPETVSKDFKYLKDVLNIK